ncbi:MAG: hypothetical protein HOV79_27890 [Hamadaea sp.]|nr:hypothetical protein [Hamadaea sp.]
MSPFGRLRARWGRLPRTVRDEIAADEVIVLAEGMFGSVTYRHVRAPRLYTSWGKNAVFGAVLVTHTRVVVSTGHGADIENGRFKHIDIPADHPIRAQLEVSVERPGRLLIAYDPAIARSDMSGRIEIRFHTSDAQRIADALTGRAVVQDV